MTTIQEYAKQRENELYEVKNKRMYRNDRRDYLREEADVDYARVLYSSSFRRLQGKMQLLIPGSLQFYRNRLTHSLEVSQIARSIAKRIGLKDTLTVQSISLAHDIGNPPFGHAGEFVLNNLNTEFPYEGNAQSFRILTNIEDKFPECNGLDLTIRTLLGVVKYPFSKSENPKKFLYNEDYQLIAQWKNDYKIKLKTIDCEIMDIADEIAYAAHDLEDSLRMKYFTIDDILHEFYNSEYKDCYSSFNDLVNMARTTSMKAHTYGTSEEYSSIFLKELTSVIVNALIQDVDLVDQSIGFKTKSRLSKGLKSLTFNAVKRRPDVIRYEMLGKKILTGLFNVFSDEKFNKDLVLLPAEYRDHNNKFRTILDYLGGMMDEYAISQYKIYFGTSSIEHLYND